MDTLLGGKLFYLKSENGSALKGKHLLPLETKYLLLE